MKIVQKLEFSFGVITLVAAIVVFYINAVPLLTSSDAQSTPSEILSGAFWFLLFPALLNAIGVFIHAVKQFTFGLVLILIGGGFLAIFLGFLLISGLALYASDMTTVFFNILPGSLAATTVCLALCPRSSSATQM